MENQIQNQIEHMVINSKAVETSFTSIDSYINKNTNLCPVVSNSLACSKKFADPKTNPLYIWLGHIMLNSYE